MQARIEVGPIPTEEDLKEEEKEKKMIWPLIIDGTVPKGFGNEYGGEIAFVTIAKEAHRIKFFLSKSATNDEKIARQIFQVAIEYYKDWEPNEPDCGISIQTDEGAGGANFEYSFHSVLIRYSLRE